MRVAIDVSEAERPKTGGGQYVDDLVRGLAQVDPANQYVLFSGLLRKSQAHDFDDLPANFHRPPRLLPGPIRVWMARRWELPAEALTGPVDVVHLPVWWREETLLGRRAANVVTVPDVSFLRHPGFFKPEALFPLRKSLVRVLARADLVLTLSEFSRGEIVGLSGFPEARIRVVPASVSERFNPTGDDGDLDLVKRRYGIRGPYILFVGTLEPRKNLDRLIRAYAVLRQRRDLPHQLVFAGAKGWLAKETVALARQVLPEDRVIICGRVTDGDLPTLYRGSDLFVYPSLYEGFGLPPLEAMACGVPVVTSNCSSLPEVVGTDAVIVNPYDQQDLVCGLEAVLGDEDLRRRLKARGPIRAGLFGRALAAQSSTKVYEEAVALHGRSSLRGRKRTVLISKADARWLGK